MNFELLRSRRYPSLALLAVAAFATVLWSAAPSANAADSTNAGESSISEPLDGGLEKSMKEMNGAMKALSRGVTADNKDAALDALSKFEAAIINAKSQTPETAEKVDEKKRPEFVASFRKTLLETLKLAADAETLILDAKYKDADQLIKTKLMAMKKTGHEKFKGDDDEHGGGPGPGKK